MRYRHVGVRYTATLESGELWEVWRVGSVSVPVGGRHWRPEMDVYETPDGLAVTLELAGVDPDAIDVLLFDDVLVVEGRRDLPPEAPGGVFRLARVRRGPFRVEVPVGWPVDAERVTARHEHGLVRIVLPRLGR